MKKIKIYLVYLMLFILSQGTQAQNCWSALGSGVTGFNYITAITTYNGNLIAAGQFDSIGGIRTYCVASWDGSSWSPLGAGINGLFDPHNATLLVSTLIVYNGELYAGGQFDSAGGHRVNNIAKWNGSSWLPLSSGILGSNFTVQSLAVYNGMLYAGGRFDTAGGIIVNNIARWDGAHWSDVDNGLVGGQGINCLMTYNGILYAGGGFSRVNNTSIRNIATWNDSIWQPLDSGIGGVNGQITSFAFYQGNLYAAIFYWGGNYSDSLALWNGNSWSLLGNVVAINHNIGIDVLFPFDGKLIIGGGFDSVGGVAANNLAQWDRTNFSGFGGGLMGGYEPQANALFEFNGNLYASGNFTQIGSDSANSIAKYTCATDGVRKISTDYIHLYPNPSTGIINIAVDNVVPGLSVQLYDLMGQKIFQSNIGGENTAINLGALAQGTYLYHIIDSTGENVSEGTLIID